MRWITLIVLAGVLAGCGQKGPLYLESKKDDAAKTASQDDEQGDDQNAERAQ